MSDNPKKNLKKDAKKTLEEISAATDQLKRSSDDSLDYSDKLLGLATRPKDQTEKP